MVSGKKYNFKLGSPLNNLTVDRDVSNWKQERGLGVASQHPDCKTTPYMAEDP
jgi:hypothetical protein